MREDTLLVAPAALARPSSSEAADGLVVPAVVLPTTATMLRWVVEGENGMTAFIPRPALHLSSVMMAWKAVLCGVGVAALPRSVVEADLCAGTLVSWGRLPDREVEIWVLHTSRRLCSPKVAAFVEFLCAEFARCRMVPAKL